jgi:hypothetical protein
MKMKPLLIDENAQRAATEINEHVNRARLMTELVSHYNRLPHLSEIDDAIEARDFLTSPVSYLNESIFNELGVTFNGKVKPDVAQLAALFGIPYASIFQRINTSLPHLTNLDRFGFDEGSKSLVLLPEGTEAIREACKIYLTNEQEIQLYEKVKGVTDQLNEMGEMFGLAAVDLNQVPRALNFISCEVKKGGKGYELLPAVNRIKEHLTRESNKK